MSQQYDYFMETRRGRPDSLWRRQGVDWQYLSLIDWSWHPAGVEQSVRAPLPDEIQPIDSTEAASLAADRQRWVSYWAEYRRPPAGAEDRPVTVVRRRRSPEQVLDEHFSAEGTWHWTDVLVEVQTGDGTSSAYVVEIDQPEAERIIQRIRGVSGATRL